MSLGTLSIDLEARLAKLEQGMDRATLLLEQRAKKMESAFAGAAKGAAALVGAVAGLGLSAFARQVIDGVDALNDFADATGTSVENASALEDVALRTGANIDTVAAAMVRFNAQLAAAKPGSEQARVFERLGLDVAKLRQLDPAEALLQTAKAFAGFAEDGDRARYVQELFGKSVREVAPFLKDLAETGRLNATVTTEQAKAAEEFNKMLASLQKDSIDLARALAADLIPRVQDFVRELKAGREAFGGWGSALRNLGTEDTGSALEGLQRYQAKLAEVRAEIERARGGEFQLDFSGMGRNRLQELEQTEARFKQFVRYYEQVLGITKLQGGRGNVVPGAASPRIGPPPDKPATTAGKGGKPELATVDIPPSLEAALKAIDAADERKLEKLREELAQLVRIASTGGAVPDSVFAAVVEEITKLDPAARQAAKAMEELERAMDEGRRVYEATRTPAEQLAAELVRLDALLAKGAISWDTYARAQFDAQQRYDAATTDAKAKADDLSDAARQLGMSFSSAFEDAIVGGERFSAVLKALDKDIARILVRKMVTEPLAGAVSNFVTGLGGGKGSGTGFDFGALIGGWLKSAFAGAFATGGYIPPGQWGLVGERGPEPAYGGRTGLTVAPAGGGVTVYMSGAGAGHGASRMTALQQAEAVGRQVRLAMRRNG